MKTGTISLPLHGGKNGYPYPVEKKTYENSISILEKAIKKLRFLN